MLSVMAKGGARAVERCRLLGRAPFSDAEDALYRGYLSSAHKAANDQLTEWMEEAGMSVRLDQAANLIGRYEGEEDSPPLIIGSHIDSVRNGGFYDGPLGIMLGIECIAELHAQGRRMTFPIEIVAFGDEEGSRFPAAMLTSRAFSGSFDPATLEMEDRNGVTVASALEEWKLDSSAYGAAAREEGSVRAYLEAHIEQGPVLEAKDLPVGVVSAIACQRRFAVTVDGFAAHAGTTPMNLRSDALAAAAQMVLAAERVAGEGPEDLVATVGKLSVLPGASNVVAGNVEMTLDIRAAKESTRDEAVATIFERWEQIADVRGVAMDKQLLQDLPASPADGALMAHLDEAIEAAGLSPFRLVSGAGHDAMVMADICPMAMLFIRCRKGISHNPEEHVEPEDVAVALMVMLGFIERLQGGDNG